MADRVICAGCRSVISDHTGIMNCSKCKQTFDTLCANFTDGVYSTLSAEYKKSWICIECRSKIPKSDNSGTPVRQTYHAHDISATSDCPDVSMCSVDNVTVRTGTRYAPVTDQSYSITDGVIDTIRTTLIQELKYCQLEFETRMTAKITKLLEEHRLAIKAEISDQISNLSKKFAGIENKVDRYSKSMAEMNPKTDDQTDIGSQTVSESQNNVIDLEKRPVDRHTTKPNQVLPSKPRLDRTKSKSTSMFTSDSIDPQRRVTLTGEKSHGLGDVNE